MSDYTKYDADYEATSNYVTNSFLSDWGLFSLQAKDFWNENFPDCPL